MNPRIPEIDNLLRRLQRDPHWKDFRLVYNYFDKTSAKIISEILDNIPAKEEDYRLYLFDFLIRTRRIFSSIILLAIYRKLADMTVLYRPLLENIVQTKILLKGRKTKSVRAIKLYRLIKELNEQKNNIKDSLDENKDIDVYFGDSACSNAINIDKIEKELQNYYEEEIVKMEKKVCQGMSWHGRSMKAALIECNSIDDYEDYDDSCKFIHVRDYGLANLDHYCWDNNYAKMKLFGITISCIYHLDDFKRVCPNSFIIKRKNTKQIDYIMIVAKLIGQILFTVSPEFRKSIEKLNIKSVQQDIDIKC
jgi:hypothetical protein